MIIFPLPSKIIFTNSADPVSSPDFVIANDKLLTVLTVYDPDDPSGLFGQHAVTTSDDRFYAIYDGYKKTDTTYEHKWLIIYQAGSKFDHEKEPVINLTLSIESHPDIPEEDRHDPVTTEVTITVNDLNERPIDILLEGSVSDAVFINYSDLDGPINLGNLSAVDPDAADDIDGVDPENRFGEVEFIESQFSSGGIALKIDEDGKASFEFDPNGLDLRFVDNLLARVGVKDNPDAEEDQRLTAFKSFAIHLRRQLAIDVAKDAISIHEDETLYFARSFGNDITVYGSSSDELTVTLTVNNATLISESSTGQKINSSFDASTEKSILTLNGLNVHQITSFLASLSLTPDQDFNGDINLNIFVEDGNGLTVSQNIEIEITPVDDGGLIVSAGDEYTYTNNQDRFIFQLDPEKYELGNHAELSDLIITGVKEPKVVYLLPERDGKIIDEDGYQVVNGLLKIKIVEDFLRSPSNKKIEYIILRSSLEVGEVGVYQSGNDIYYRQRADDTVDEDVRVARLTIATLHQYQQKQIAEGYFTKQYIYEFLSNPDETIFSDDEWESLQKLALENLMNNLQVDGTYEVNLDDVNEEYQDVYIEGETTPNSGTSHYFIIHEQLISMRFFDGQTNQATNGSERFFENIQIITELHPDYSTYVDNVFTIRFYFSGDNPYEFKDSQKTKIFSENITEVLIDDNRTWNKEDTGNNEGENDPITITYFLPKILGVLKTLEQDVPFDLKSVNNVTIEVIEKALDHISAMANVKFVETKQYDQSKIDFYFTQFDPTENILGASVRSDRFLGGDVPDKKAELIILPNFGNSTLPDYGAHSINTLLHVTIHEIMHSLGLRHPSFQQGNEPSPYISSEFSVFENTIMAYVNKYGYGYSNLIKPTSLQDFDLQALHHIYGTNSNTNSSDTTYDFSNTDDLRGYITIHDNGGIDTLKFDTSLPEGVNINLTPGTHSTTLFSESFFISNETIIENIIGTAYHDRFIGNDADNIFEGLAGHDHIDGGYGNDTVTYQKSVLGVNIDLTRPDGEQERNGNSEVNQWDHGSGDVLVNIENITGSLFNDTLTGNNKANILDGTRGSDTLTGGYGEDIFIVDFQIGHGWDVITDFKRSVDTLILRVTEEINDMRSAFEDGVFEISKPNNHQFDVNFTDNLNDGFSIQFIDTVREYESLTDALGLEDIQLEFV